MHVRVALEYALLSLGLFGLLTSTVFLGMVLAGVAAFRRQSRLHNNVLSDGPEFLPGVSLFKPLHGAEPDLESNLRSFFAQEYGEAAVQPARIEILFCARTLDDPGMKIACKVAAGYPAASVRFIASGEPWGANAKACSLATMAKLARHDLWVVSDSDVRVDSHYLRDVVLPFADPKVGCVTCLYRGVSHGGIWSQLEAVGMTVEMSSGVLAANLIEPMQFALGPTMSARRSCIEQIGGFEAMVDFCADDFVLGNWIAARGHRVVLSAHVIDHIILNTSFLDSMRHQVRWMKSTRFSRPKGHFGTSLTFGMPFGLIASMAALLLGRPMLAGSCLGFSLAARCLQGWIVAKYVVKDRQPLQSMLLFPLRDLMGLFFWAASYGSNRIFWRGELYELLDQGRMRSVGHKGRGAHSQVA